MGNPKYHFISGLPRSGSSLLAAILRQNPRFAAGMSGPVAGLFEGVVSQVSVGTELSRMVNKEQRERILRGLFDSYYADNDAQVIFDTNRAWTAKLPELMTLFPESKIICCARDVAWIMDSLEKQYRESAFENTGLFGNPGERATVYTRTEALAGSNRLVGYAYQALREACWSAYADRLVIVEYDLLVARPKEVIGLLYEFIGEESFEHDFDNVEYEAPNFDEPMGLENLHKVRRKVEMKPRQTILPPDLFEKFSGMAFWQNLTNCRAFRIVNAQPQPEQTDDVEQMKEAGLLEGASTD